MSLYSSSRDPNNFSRPNEFLPERWIRNTNGSYDNVLNPFATIPFALGVRSCIGRKISETQMIMTLSEVIKIYLFYLFIDNCFERIIQIFNF